MLKRKYLNDNLGNFAIKLALLAPLLLISLGVAIDTSRLVSAKQKLQYATDSSALGVARAYQNIDTEQTVQNITVRKTPDDTIVMNTKSKLEPIFIQIFGYPKLEVSAASEVNIFQNIKTEVALVVDHSGSLKGNGGFTHLSNALDVFMDSITEQNDMGDLYVSFLPWAGTVNVGNEHSSWLKNYDSDLFGDDNWHGCMMARKNDLDLTDNPPIGSDKFEPFAWPSDVWNDWQDKPVDEYIDYPTEINIPSLGPNAGCSVEMVPLTNKRDKIQVAMDEYKASISNRIGTLTPIAMAWAQRALSPKWRGYWKGPTPPNLPTNEGNKIIVFLSDGNAYWRLSESKNPDFSPYGYLSENQLNIKNPKSKPNRTKQLRKAMNKRFLQICDNIKAEGVQIYTIGYALNKKSAKVYQDCATSKSHFFHSPASSQISETFKSIATEIVESQTRLVN